MNGDLVDGTIKYFDIMSSEVGFWQIEINDILVNGEGLNICGDHLCKGILSTGTSIIGGERSMVESILKAIDSDPYC